MRYESVKEFAESKKISIKMLAEMIGMSDAGLYKAINNQSLRVDHLEKIAEVLEIDVTYFFDEKKENMQVSVVNNGHLKDTNIGVNTIRHHKSIRSNTDYEREVEYLHKLLEEKERLIEVLMSKSV